MRKALGVGLLTALLAAGAAQAADMSAEDQAILDGLSPQLREEVKARATGENTVTGVLETMLLNSISEALATGEVAIVEVDYVEGMATVQMPDGETETVSFETETLEIIR